MIAKSKAPRAKIRSIISALGIPMAKNADMSAMTPEQQKIRSAAPLYVTDEQLFTLEKAAEDGWKGKAVVVSVQLRVCSVAIEKDGHVAWIMPDGRVDSELLVAKRALASEYSQEAVKEFMVNEEKPEAVAAPAPAPQNGNHKPAAKKASKPAKKAPAKKATHKPNSTHH